jgi:hypothetical protein
MKGSCGTAARAALTAAKQGDVSPLSKRKHVYRAVYPTGASHAGAVSRQWQVSLKNPPSSWKGKLTSPPLFLGEPQLPHVRLLVDGLSFQMKGKSGLRSVIRGCWPRRPVAWTGRPRATGCIVTTRMAWPGWWTGPGLGVSLVWPMCLGTTNARHPLNRGRDRAER